MKEVVGESVFAVTEKTGCLLEFIQRNPSYTCNCG